MKKALFIALVATFFGPMTANADFISGSIGFVGTWTATDGTDSVAIEDATTIDFGFGMVLGAGTGTYDGVPSGTTVTFQDLTFNPTFVANNPVWEFVVGAGESAIIYSFALSTIVVDLQSTTELNLSGIGTASVTGYEDTIGTWVFTGNSITFSSVSEVPEPATLALFGLGLVGFGFASRRKFAKA